VQVLENAKRMALIRQQRSAAATLGQLDDAIEQKVSVRFIHSVRVQTSPSSLSRDDSCLEIITVQRRLRERETQDAITEMEIRAMQVWIH
jgi:hypothetical protein